MAKDFCEVIVDEGEARIKCHVCEVSALPVLEISMKHYTLCNK